MFYFRENNVPIKPEKTFLKYNANQPPPNTFPINNKPIELQGRQPETAHFSFFKQAGFPPQKGPASCSAYQPINEERKHPEEPNNSTTHQSINVERKQPEGPTNRTYQPINEERKQPENTSRSLLNSQQERTSITFASELGNALPLKDDTQTNLFGIARRSGNISSLHNNAKSVWFGANETSQNDSLQKSVKAEQDQSSSQLYDEVLEQRLRLTQMEFEKDYSEVENSFQPKPFEDKTSLKSPTR